jgi:hypothetical protein
MPNPNTAFTAGQILTAAEMNRVPRGVIAITNSSSNTLASNILTGLNTTFTAEANRAYRVTVYIFTLGSAANDRLIVTLRSNAVNLNRIIDYVVPASVSMFTTIQTSFVFTPSAGAQALTLFWDKQTGNVVPNASSATITHQLVVEDIGPA